MKVTSEDLAEMVGDNCEHDLLVIGLQEAPRSKVSKLLKAALLDTHM